MLDKEVAQRINAPSTAAELSREELSALSFPPWLRGISTYVIAVRHAAENNGGNAERNSTGNASSLRDNAAALGEVAVGGLGRELDLRGRDGGVDVGNSNCIETVLLE